MKILGITRVSPGIRPMMLRCGVAYFMSGVVEATSLGKTTTDWRMTAVHMAEDRAQLRSFLERISHQRPRPDRSGWRAYSAIGGAVAIAQGTVEIASMGRLTTNWSMLWMCYGEEIIESVTARLARGK